MLRFILIKISAHKNYCYYHSPKPVKEQIRSKEHPSIKRYVIPSHYTIIYSFKERQIFNETRPYDYDDYK